MFEIKPRENQNLEVKIFELTPRTSTTISFWAEGVFRFPEMIQVLRTIRANCIAPWSELNKIILKKNIYIDTLMIEEPQFREWNRMIKELKQAYKEVVIIKNK